MATMILAAERPALSAVPKPVAEILSDRSMSIGEKLLPLEGLFVHDSTPGPQVGCGRSV